MLLHPSGYMNRLTLSTIAMITIITSPRISQKHTLYSAGMVLTSLTTSTGYGSLRRIILSLWSVGIWMSNLKELGFCHSEWCNCPLATNASDIACVVSSRDVSLISVCCTTFELSTFGVNIVSVKVTYSLTSTSFSFSRYTVLVQAHAHQTIIAMAIRLRFIVERENAILPSLQELALRWFVSGDGLNECDASCSNLIE